LGFSKFLLADTEFANDLDEILKKGPVYQKLKIKLMTDDDFGDKVKSMLGD
jgi:hypothetical protein